MRVYIVLLALTAFVVEILAEKNKPKDVANSTKKGIESVFKFFYEGSIGKQIAQLPKDWNKTVLEAQGKIRVSLVEYCRGPANETT
uniref:8 kDa glycoprotein n=2 Tax=Taeniidae TaxID=6208 RepID=B6E484_ECHGR|nr:8 kDa glycoprotein [Echinococcus granulosus]ACI42363.1 8 kDa glycoprotein [Taenia hydatigena]